MPIIRYKPVSLAEPLPTGKAGRIMLESESVAGSKAVEFTVDAEAILVSLHVRSISGDLDVVVKTVTSDTDSTQEFVAALFPTVTAASSELLIRKAATILDRVVIEATWTDAVEFEIRARGLSTGEASVSILGAQEASAVTPPVVTTTPGVLVPASGGDRSGLIIKNNNTASGILYIGFSMAEIAFSGGRQLGYPLRPLEPLGVDVAAGVPIYAVADSGTIDVRLLSAGN